MLPNPLRPPALVNRSTAFGVLTAVLIPPLVHAARAVALRPAPVPVRARVAGPIAGTAPRCLR